MTKTTVNVLGTDYTLIICDESEHPKLKGCDGYCDETTRECVVESFDSMKDDINSKGNLEMQTKKTVRHELIHAFLHESGLAENSDWAQREEMVDWFAKQFPKLKKAFEDADAL